MKEEDFLESSLKKKNQAASLWVFSKRLVGKMVFPPSFEDQFEVSGDQAARLKLPEENVRPASLPRHF